MKEIQKHSHLRKRVQMQKCINLLSTNKYVLFFHYSGRSACNWQQIKDQLWEKAVCKSLLVQSKRRDHSFASQFLETLSSPLRSCAAHEGEESTRVARGSQHRSLSQPSIKKGGGPAGELQKGPVLASLAERAKAEHSVNKHLLQGPTLLVACSSLEQFNVVVKKCVPPHFVCIGGVYEKTPLTHLDIQRCIQLHGHGEQVYHALLKPLTQWHSFLHLLQNQMNWHFLKFHQKKMVALLEEYHRSASAPAKELVTESRP